MKKVVVGLAYGKTETVTIEIENKGYGDQTPRSELFSDAENVTRAIYQNCPATTVDRMTLILLNNLILEYQEDGQMEKSQTLIDAAAIVRERLGLRN